MRSTWLVLTLLSAGCGGEAVIDPPLGTGGGGAGSTSSSSTVASSTTTISSSSGGAMDFSVAIRSAIGGANCQPVVPPDPMNMEIVLEVDNTMNAQALQVSVTGAAIQGDNAFSSFEVDILQSGLISAGTKGTLELLKVPGSLMGSPGSGCAWCELDELQNSTLILDVVAEGLTFTVEGRVDSYGCSF